MKVFINKRTGSYSGGMIIAAANNAMIQREIDDLKTRLI